MVDLGDDIMDSRDLEDWLSDLIDAGLGQDIDDIRTRKILRELKAETEGEGWEWGIGFIRDSYFEQYARDLADDIGAVNADVVWPNNFIDWEQAAEALKMDYSSVTIDGVDYWYREA